MSGSSQKALPNVQECSRGPPGCPGVVGRHFRMIGRPSRMSRRGREALPDVREWSGGHFLMSEIGWEALRDVWE